jgi:hypothetical protein
MGKKSSSSGGVEIITDTTKLDEILRNLKGEHVKIVADGVAYGVYWELGHTTSTGAFLQHPFLAPALEMYRKPMNEAMKQAIDRGDLALLDDVVDKIAMDVANRAKVEINSIKDKGNGNASDLVDTGALLNSIQVLDPEEV